MIELARERSLALLTTDYPMFLRLRGYFIFGRYPDGNDV
jgi:hypothetical protein